MDIALIFDGHGGSENKPIHSPLSSEKSEVEWRHLNYTNDEDIHWLKSKSELPPLVIEALLAQETRPRTTPVNEGLLIALRGVNLNPGADPEDMVSIRLWVDQNRIVSTYKRELLSVADILAQFDQKRGPKSTAEFLALLINRLTERMSDTVDVFEDHVAELEEGVLAEEDDPLIKRELSSLRRQAITLRRYLAPQREALSRIVSEKIDWLAEESRLNLRESGDRLIRHIEDLDAVRERAVITQEELIGRLSEQLNSRMYILSVVAAIFLPLGFLTGLLGVNLGGIPGSENQQAFSIFLIALVALLIGSWVLFKWKRWL